MDKVLSYCTREETRVIKQTNSTKNLSLLIAPMGKVLSNKAFQMLLVQFNDGLNYSCKLESEGVFLVERKGLDTDREVFPRTVKKLEDSSWSCSCNRVVYSGILCRHILCVVISLQKVVCKEWIHSRWWIDMLQPKVILRRKSPFVSINEGEVVVG